MNKQVLQKIPALTIKNQFQEMGLAVISSDILESCGFPFRFFLHRVPWQVVVFSFAALACAPLLSKKPSWAMIRCFACALRLARLGCPTDAGTEKRRAEISPPFSYWNRSRASETRSSSCQIASSSSSHC
jgi:hypothetical protein